MAVTKRNALELQRIVKEVTGREISIGEAYAIWGYILKLLKLLWKVEERKKNPPADQKNLFNN